MRKLIVKYLNIAVMLAFEAWFLWPYDASWHFEWEPLIGLLVSLSTYIGIEAKDHFSEAKESRVKKPPQSDINLYEKFNELFPAAVVAFFRDHDFHNTFRVAPMKKLFEYVDDWTTAEHEFVNDEIQDCHSIFRKKAKALSSKLAESTGHHSPGLATVAPSGSLGGPLPEYNKNEARELNKLANEFVEAHQQFYRQLKKYINLDNAL